MVDEQCELSSDIGGSVMILSTAQFLNSEMDPDEEKFDAQELAFSLAKVYSIAN